MTAPLPPDEKFLLNVRMAIKPYQGEEHRISKEELSLKLFGKYHAGTDRKIRMAVSELQTRGELIFTDCDAGSYFYLGDDPEPARRYINQEMHRGNAIIAKARALEQALRSTRGIDAQQGRLI